PALGPSRRREFCTFNAHDPRRAHAQAQLGAIENAIDHVAAPIDAIIDEFGALPSDDKERRQFAGLGRLREFDPSAASVIEDAQWRPRWASAAHDTYPIIKVERTHLGVRYLLACAARIAPRDLRGICLARLRYRFHEISTPVSNQ